MKKRYVKNRLYSTKQDIAVKVVCVVILAFVILLGKDLASLDMQLQEVTLASCVDGDTARFMIAGKEEKVRFLAVDTPETVKPGTAVQPYGKEASNYTCKRLSEASVIRLEYENDNERDKYDRMLAWIFVDEELLQLKLVEQGLAKVAYLYDDYMYTNILQDAEKLVKSKALGVWSE